MKKDSTDHISCTAAGQDNDFIDTVRGGIPMDITVEDIATLFKVFGDPTRLRIMYALKDRELCVYHIAQTLDMSQSAISHQLRVLRENHLVKSRRDGKLMIYSLDDDHVLEIISQGFDHIEHIEEDARKEKEKS